MLAKVAADGTVSVRGDPDHPANFGKLCSKGSALGETMGLDGRVLHPEIGGKRAGWDSALDLVAQKFSETIAEHGPDSVGFYISGQLLTEDYYVANKLMKGFIGSANIDTNSRLCMASSVAGHRRAFGEDIVPGTYEDFEQADLVVLTGSNTAWCHPILYQRLLAARKQRGTKIVVIDPRRTATADECDLHLALNPGTDVLLFNGLLAHLAQVGRPRRGLCRSSTSGFDDRPVDRGRGCAVARARRRRLRPEAGRRQALLRPVRSDRKNRHGLQPGRQPVGAWHRQGQCHHQLPSGDRADRQARHGSVLGDRAAERDGRARGRRSGQPACRAHELRDT